MAQQGLNTFNDTEALNTQLGLRGFKRISNTDAVTADFLALVAINGSAVVAASTVEMGDPLSSGDLLLEGVPVFGPFTSIQLTSGTILAYYI